MELKRILSTAIAGLALGAAGVSFAGNPNPTLSQDPYWDLPDQGAAWRDYRAEQARAAARDKAQEKAQRPAPVAERAAKG
jgi:hypothetical protein